MNLLDLANASLQAIATGLVASGGLVIYNDASGERLLGGIVLIIAGLAAYVIYEKLPSSQS